MIYCRFRYARAAEHYCWPTAETSMRKARKKIIPPLPPTLDALKEYLEQHLDRYKCCGHSFYQDYTIDNQGKYTVIFGCIDLIRKVVNQGGEEVHADATFKVVPSRPNCRQLFIMHIIIQNHVSFIII